MKPTCVDRPVGPCMKPLRCAWLFAPVLLVTLLTAPLVCADDLAGQLKADYQDKVLTLRHFYAGDHLVFQSDGSLSGPAEVGPWTVDAEVSVESVKLRGRVLQIRGRRVCLVFDYKAKPYRDVLAMLAESKRKDQNHPADFFRKRKVNIEINFSGGNPGLNDVTSAMRAVFLVPEELIGDFVPDFWRGYFDQIESQSRSARDSDERVYSVKEGEVSSPQAIYSPEPEFAEEARIAKFQGTATVSAVVDPSGAAKDIQIVSPLGLGLDERAVEAIRTWKFKPGMKDGEPVPVQIAVEVSFYLY